MWTERKMTKLPITKKKNKKLNVEIDRNRVFNSAISVPLFLISSSHSVSRVLPTIVAVLYLYNGLFLTICLSRFVRIVSKMAICRREETGRLRKKKNAKCLHTCVAMSHCCLCDTENGGGVLGTLWHTTTTNTSLKLRT